MNRFQRWLSGSSKNMKESVIDSVVGGYALLWGYALYSVGPVVARWVAPFQWLLLGFMAATFAWTVRILLGKLTYWAVHQDRPERHNDRRDDSASH